MPFFAHATLTCQGTMIYPNNDNLETPATKVPMGQRTKTIKK